MPALFKTSTVMVLLCAVLVVHSTPSKTKKDIHEHIPALVERYERMKEDIKLLEETMTKIKEYNVVIEEENTAPSDAEIAADGGAEGNPEESPLAELLLPDVEISEGNATDGGGEFVAELIEEVPQPSEPDEGPVEPNMEPAKTVEQGPSVMQSALQAALARLRARLAAEKAGKDPDKIAGPAPDLLEKNSSVAAVNESAAANESSSDAQVDTVVASAPAVVPVPQGKPTAEQMNAHLSMMDMLRQRIHGNSNPTLDALRARLNQPHSIKASLYQSSVPVDHSGSMRVRRKRSIRDVFSKNGVSFLRSRRSTDSTSKSAEKSAKRAARRAARRKERETKKRMRKLNKRKEKDAKKQARKALNKNKKRVKRSTFN